MSLVTERIENNVLYLELNGRIDSSNAEQAEALIKAIKEAHPDLQSVLDHLGNGICKLQKQFWLAASVVNID